MAQVSGIEVKFSADTSDLDKGIASASGKIQNFSKLAAVGLAGLATAAAAGGVAIGALTKQAINFADEIGKTAQKIGMTSESLSKLEYAAKLSDISLGQLQIGLGQLSKNMQSGDEAFAALGITIADAQGNLRSTEQVLLDIAERFAGMEGGAGKTALAMQIFGRSGADLIPFLNAGRDGLAEMTDEAARFGLEISTNTSRAAEGFNDNLTRLGGVLTGLGNKIAERSAPAMKELTDRFINFIDKGNYVERIASVIGSAMDKLAEAVQWASSAWEVFAIRINAGIAVLGYLTDLDLSGAMDAWAASSVAAGKVWQRNAEILAQLRGEVQSVNSELKGDLETPKSKAPILPGTGGAAGGAEEFSVAPSQEPGTAFTDRLAMIKEQFATEREILAEEYTLNQETLDVSLANKLLSEQEYYDLSRKLAEDHATSLASIQSQRLDGDLTAASSFFGSMAQVAQSGGKRLLKVAKAAAAAQAVVDTIRAAVSAMNDPTAITPIQKFANYAAVFAKGMSAVAAIKGVSEGGGGGGGGGRRGGDGGASAAPAAAAPTTTFQFTMMNDPMGFGEKFARQFIDQLNSTQRNGGTIRGVIA